jgi:hypothetical protein
MGEDLNTPVSGPSAFWVLAALALNCMLQPCGKVCGFHPRLRTYLRSSPFVAVSDTVAIIIRFGVYLFHGLSPAQAAHAICTVRFKDQNVSEPDGIQALEGQVWVRSLAFLLGLVSQTIKIFACGGLPLTRAAAVAYLCSFFILEILNFLRGWSNLEDDDASTSQLTTEETKRILHKVDYGLGIFAILVHSAFLVWALNSILYPLWWFEVDGNWVTPGWFLIIILFFLTPPLLLTYWLGALLKKCFGWDWDFDSFWILLYVFVLGVWWNVFWNLFAIKTDGNWAIFSTPTYIGNEITFVVVVLKIFYEVVARLSVFPFWKKQVLFLTESVLCPREIHPKDAQRLSGILFLQLLPSASR